MRELNHWDYRYLSLAKHVAGWSKDPSTKTGAVITLDNHIVSVGFNGFARGVDDTPERYENRDIKYKIIVHCEINAMHFASVPLKGATLYTWPFMSCSNCAASVVQNQFKECVAPYSDNPRWVEAFKLTEMQFKEAGIDLMLVDETKIDIDSY
jgi:dCMP deaminase